MPDFFLSRFVSCFNLHSKHEGICGLRCCDLFYLFRFFAFLHVPIVLSAQALRCDDAMVAELSSSFLHCMSFGETRWVGDAAILSASTGGNPTHINHPPWDHCWFIPNPLLASLTITCSHWMCKFGIELHFIHQMNPLICAVHAEASTVLTEVTIWQGRARWKPS